MSQKKNNSNNSKKPQNAYFVHLELENVRCFIIKQKINFLDKDENPAQWTIILGDNGTGKTTILQILFNYFAMILLTSENDEGTEKYNQSTRLVLDQIKDQVESLHSLTHEELIREQSDVLTLGEKLTELKKKLDERQEFYETISLNQKRFGFSGKLGGRLVLSSNKISKNCFAYGASRKSGDSSISDNQEFAYKTLFDETILLINPEEWLLQADYAASRDSEFKEKRRRKFEKIKEILIKVLPDIDEIRIADRETEGISFPTVEFYTPYGWVQAKDLSLGYRTSMAWIVDFASRMFDLYPESENPLAEPAIVLIDEIDLHLHPKWQRELIDYLTNLFPNTQFIVTTHSPLIVQAAAARDANIVVCRREGDHVVIDQSVEAVRGWRADQILTSDLFDLPSTRDTELEKLEKQRRQILSKPKLTKTDEKKLKILSAELDDLRVMENAEDDKAMDIIRRAAQHLQNGKN